MNNESFKPKSDLPLIKLFSSQSKDIFVLLDHDFKVTLFNPIAEKLFDCLEKDAIGAPFKVICDKVNTNFFLNKHIEHILSNTITANIYTHPTSRCEQRRM